MDVIGRGIIAGFLAALALGVLASPIATLSRMLNVHAQGVIWPLHLLVGSLLWGASFALLHRLLPGPNWLRGALFGLAAWLAVTVAVTPFTHAGLFGLSLGYGPAAAMWAIHLVYGALLGGIFGLLDPNGGRPRIDDEHLHDDHFHPLPR